MWRGIQEYLWYVGAQKTIHWESCIALHEELLLIKDFTDYIHVLQHVQFTIFSTFKPVPANF